MSFIATANGVSVPESQVRRIRRVKRTSEWGTYHTFWLDTLDGETYEVDDLPVAGEIVPNANPDLVILRVRVSEEDLTAKTDEIPIVAWHMQGDSEAVAEPLTVAPRNRNEADAILVRSSGMACAPYDIEWCPRLEMVALLTERLREEVKVREGRPVGAIA